LPPPDATNINKAHQEFCENLLFAAKQCIPRRRCKNYILGDTKKNHTKLTLQFRHLEVDNNMSSSQISKRL